MRQKSWKARKQSKNLYISSACYSDYTKRMLYELHEHMDRCKKAAINSLKIDILPRSLVDMILEEQRKINQYTEEQLIYNVPKFVISGDYIPFEWLKGNPNLGLVQPYCKIELNNEKEKEKMDAKKCDRCGELYIETHAPIKAFLCGRVTDGEKQTYTHEKIKEMNTYTMEVKLSVYGSKIDMCPDCCKKLAEFFESGADRFKES